MRFGFQKPFISFRVLRRKINFSCECNVIISKGLPNILQLKCIEKKKLQVNAYK